MRARLLFPALLALSLLGTGCPSRKEPPAPLPSATARAPAPPVSASAAPPAPPPAELGKRTADCLMAFDRTDYEELGRCYADDATSHWLDSGLRDESGRGNIIENRKKSLKTAFPDAKLVPQLVFVNGMRVFGSAVMSGTQKGALIGADGVLPATKKPFGELAFFSLRFDDRLTIREEWLLVDRGSLLFQLGQSKEKARARNTQGLVNAPVLTASSGSPAELANVQVVEKGWRALAEENLAGFSAALADDAVLADQAAPADARGKQAVLLETEAWLKVFSQIDVACPDRFGAGAYVVSLCRVTAVNDGSRGKEAATNRKVTLSLAEIVRLEGGLEREILRFADGAALATALGQAPPAPPASGSKP